MKGKTNVYMTVSGIPIKIKLETEIEDTPFTMTLKDGTKIKVTVSELEIFSIFLKRNPQFKNHIYKILYGEDYELYEH